MSQGESTGRLMAPPPSDDFHIARSKAIVAYATLEHVLCQLFAVLTEMKAEIAATVFFKITAYRVRDEILEKTLKKKHGARFSIFWNSLRKQIDQVSRTRNEIVHWLMANQIAPDWTIDVVLTPPNIWNHEPQKNKFRVDDLNDYAARCRLLAFTCQVFVMFITPSLNANWSKEQVETWSDIFQKELPYPIPDTHPLFPISSRFRNLLPASPTSPEP